MAIKINGELGDIFIENNVIATIVGSVANKCYGVVGMASRNKTDGIVNLLKGDSISKGINVNVQEKGVVVDIHIVAEYGTNINTICNSIVNRAKYTLEHDVGLKVHKINIKVEGIRVDE